METVRKTKIAQEPTIDETVNSEVKQVPSCPEDFKPEAGNSRELTISEMVAMIKPDIHTLLQKAPELYGNNPTAADIEDFKQKEIVWRKQLGNLQ